MIKYTQYKKINIILYVYNTFEDFSYFFYVIMMFKKY